MEESRINLKEHLNLLYLISFLDVSTFARPVLVIKNSIFHKTNCVSLPHNHNVLMIRIWNCPLSFVHHDP